MKRCLTLLAAALVLAGCNQKQEVKFPEVDLHGRLEVDQDITAQRQQQGIEGQWYKRVLSVDGKDMDFDAFVKTWCPETATRNETCVKAWRIQKIDKVAGATRFLPNGL